MQSFTVAFTIPAAAAIPNILQGLPPEIIAEACTLTLYGNSSAITTSHSLSVYRGPTGEVLVPAGSVVGIASSANKVRINEDFLGMFPLAAGSRLIHAIVGVNAVTGLMQYVLQ